MAALWRNLDAYTAAFVALQLSTICQAIGKTGCAVLCTEARHAGQVITTNSVKQRPHTIWIGSIVNKVLELPISRSRTDSRLPARAWRGVCIHYIKHRHIFINRPCVCMSDNACIVLVQHWRVLLYLRTYPRACAFKGVCLYVCACIYIYI